MSDPTAPVPFASADTGYGSGAVVVSDDFVHVAHWRGGAIVTGGVSTFRDCWDFGDGFASGDSSAWPLIVP